MKRRYRKIFALWWSKHCVSFSAQFRVARIPSNRGKSPSTRLSRGWMIQCPSTSSRRIFSSSLNRTNRYWMRRHPHIPPIDHTTTATTTDSNNIHCSTTLHEHQQQQEHFICPSVRQPLSVAGAAPVRITLLKRNHQHISLTTADTEPRTVRSD